MGARGLPGEQRRHAPVRDHDGGHVLKHPVILASKVLARKIAGEEPPHLLRERLNPRGVQRFVGIQPFVHLHDERGKRTQPREPGILQQQAQGVLPRADAAMHPLVPHPLSVDQFLVQREQRQPDGPQPGHSQGGRHRVIGHESSVAASMDRMAPSPSPGGSAAAPHTVLAFLTNGFPAWVLAASVLALWHPAWFTWFSGPLITVGLAVIMLGMGLTLGMDDARRVARRRGAITAGVALQYTVMPGLGWALAALYDLPTPMAVGLILVSCCPGGTASNVIAFLARADVAVSVAMTAVSTLLAVMLTPSLTALLAGSRIDVPAAGLLLSTLQVVVLPLAVGGLLKRWAPRLTAWLLPVSPLVAVVLITLIVASIIGAGRDAILEAGARLLLAVASLHAGGFLLGYLITRVGGAPPMTARTMSIEVGMQNSGLGVVLARQNFVDPLVAIPSAISSLCHSLIGSLLAAVWRRAALRRPEPAGVADQPAAASVAPRG